jgi:hypothetical protein
MDDAADRHDPAIRCLIATVLGRDDQPDDGPVSPIDQAPPRSKGRILAGDHDLGDRASNQGRVIPSANGCFDPSLDGQPRESWLTFHDLRSSDGIPIGYAGSLEAIDQVAGSPSVRRFERGQPGGLGRLLRGRRSASRSGSIGALRADLATAPLGDRIDAPGQGRWRRRLLSRQRDRLLRSAERPERPTHERQAELVGLGRVDDHPGPRLGLDAEALVPGLPAASSYAAKRLGV